MAAVRDEAASAEPSRTPPLIDAAWAAGLAAVLLPLTIVAVVDAARGSRDTAWAIITIGCFVLLHLAVILRRRRPRTALAVASALMLVLTAASVQGTPTIAVLLPSSLAYLAFVYTAASSDRRGADVAAAVLGMSGAGVITAVAVAHDFGGASSPAPGAAIALAGFLVASIGAAWALGRYRRESRRKLVVQDLAREQSAALRVQAERELAADDRRRVGREVHDVVSHSLAVMVAQAEASRVLLERGDARAREAIENVVATGRTALSDMRGLLGALSESPESAAAQQVPPRSPAPGLADLAVLVERVSAPDRVVTIAEEGARCEVSPAVALAAYRVVQESLTNTLKHAPAPTRSDVRLCWSDVLEVMVVDDGVSSGARGVEGRGIQGMRERVASTGGRFTSGSMPDRGWRTVAHLPVVPAATVDVPAAAADMPAATADAPAGRTDRGAGR